MQRTYEVGSAQSIVYVACTHIFIQALLGKIPRTPKGRKKDQGLERRQAETPSFKRGPSVVNRVASSQHPTPYIIHTVVLSSFALGSNSNLSRHHLTGLQQQDSSSNSEEVYLLSPRPFKGLYKLARGSGPPSGRNCETTS